MWMWIANKFAKFHATRLNQIENIPKSFWGVATFLKHPVEHSLNEIIVYPTVSFIGEF